MRTSVTKGTVDPSCSFEQPSPQSLPKLQKQPLKIAGKLALIILQRIPPSVHLDHRVLLSAIICLHKLARFLPTLVWVPAPYVPMQGCGCIMLCRTAVYCARTKFTVTKGSSKTREAMLTFASLTSPPNLLLYVQQSARQTRHAKVFPSNGWEPKSANSFRNQILEHLSLILSLIIMLRTTNAIRQPLRQLPLQQRRCKPASLAQLL